MTRTSTSAFTSPVINATGQHIAARQDSVEPSGKQGRARSLDTVVADTVLTQRRRESGGAREDQSGPRRSTVSDEDKVLHLAVLADVMREQGFCVRSVARVRHRAEQMLDAFGREGIAVPRPRVFDPDAPSQRDRHAPVVAGRTPPAREIERTPAESSPAR